MLERFLYQSQTLDLKIKHLMFDHRQKMEVQQVKYEGNGFYSDGVKEFEFILAVDI